MKFVIRTLDAIAPDYILAVERHLASSDNDDGIPLRELVQERRERMRPAEHPTAIVFDTTHARDGVLDIAGARRDARNGVSALSAKKFAYPGDIVLSRLRPYLRQVAFVHPAITDQKQHLPLAFSTEFYVLTPNAPLSSIAFLLPFFLCHATQRALADAQEGGHHPRVPLESLFALHVPRKLLDKRATSSRHVQAALGDLYAATDRLTALIEGP
jgi:hypothetical protein